MKFEISQAEFLKSLTLTNKSLLTKANLPILSNVLISVSKQVEVVSTNLESATRVTLKAKIDSEGETTLLGRAVFEFVSQLDTASNIIFEKLGEEAVVTSGTYSARFATMDASEFPAIPKVSGGKELSVSAQELERSISSVAFCAAQDESRPILTGVLCDLAKDTLRFVATDGYRLGFSQVSVEKSNGQTLTFIMPAKTLTEVAKIVTEVNGEQSSGAVNMLVADNLTQAVFKVGNVEFTSRLIEGEFPNWQKIIPTDFVSKATVSKVELTRVVKMSSIFARESGNIIKLNLAPSQKGGDSLIVGAVTAQVGSATGSIDTKLEGKGGEIAFNYRYLLDALNVLDGDEVVFEMNESLNPGRLTSASNGKSVFHIVMPVRLQG